MKKTSKFQTNFKLYTSFYISILILIISILIGSTLMILSFAYTDPLLSNGRNIVNLYNNVDLINNTKWKINIYLSFWTTIATSILVCVAVLMFATIFLSNKLFNKKITCGFLIFTIVVCLLMIILGSFSYNTISSKALNTIWVAKTLLQ